MKYTNVYIDGSVPAPRRSLCWVGSARTDLRRFPAEARARAGHQLHLVQCGLEPADWKPMPTVGVGVRELRIRSGREHRVFFVARFGEVIHVLHAFEKKSRRTSRSDLEIGQVRYRAVLSRHLKGGKP
jgi:phage-related protein